MCSPGWLSMGYEALSLWVSVYSSLNGDILGSITKIWEYNKCAHNN